MGQSSSVAFDPIIEIMKSASAPVLDEKAATMERSASSTMDTGVKPKLVVAHAETTIKTPSKVNLLFFISFSFILLPLA